MRNKIRTYLNENLKYFDLEGVEITEDDIDVVEKNINKYNKPLEIACDEVLKEIRDCLDDGLDDELDDEVYDNQ